MEKQRDLKAEREELYRLLPYLPVHNEAMGLLRKARRNDKDSPEFREGMLAAYRIEEEALRIFREIPGLPEEREPEWPYFHRGIAVMALQGGLPDEAAYWAEEGLRAVSDTELRDQLFSLIAKSRPERLLKRFEAKKELMNLDTGCFKDLPVEEHTPENAVDCFSELIAMLDALEEWAGELYEEWNLVVYAMISRRNRMRWAAEALDSTVDYFEYYHDIVSNDLQWLIDFDHINLTPILNLYIYCSIVSYGSAQKAGVSSQADILMSRIEEIVEKKPIRFKIPGDVLYIFYLARGSRETDALTKIEYFSKASSALLKLPMRTEAERGEYLICQLLISFEMAYSYIRAENSELAYKSIAKQEKEIRDKDYRHLLDKLGIDAWYLYADLSLLAAKILFNRKSRKYDFVQYLNWTEIYIDKIRRHASEADFFSRLSSGEIEQELVRLSSEVKMLKDKSDINQTQFSKPHDYLSSFIGSMADKSQIPAFS